VPDLYEAYYRDTALFEQLYLKYEKQANLKKKIVSAEEIFKNSILKERTDTGRIYIVNIDNVINQGPFDCSITPVYQSNLCQEICLPTVPFQSLDDEGEYKLTMDNGQEVTLTGQHRVLLKDGSLKKVRELTENDDIEKLLE
jgi:ribonucleotide reductase alpha subunit